MIYSFASVHVHGLEFGRVLHVHGLNKERGDQVNKSSIVGASLTSQSCHLSPILFIALSFLLL